MGTIDTRIDYQKDITIQTVTGVITEKEIIESIESFYAGRVTRKLLWDFTTASLEKMGSDEIARIAHMAKKFSQRRAGGRTAFVFSTDLGFGLGRMYDTHHDDENSLHAHMVFRNIDDALKWLDESQ